jgi:outer membrane protein OmpA-like peptidoglycan-associated protein
MRTLETLLVALAVLAPFETLAADAEGCTDHPLFTRMKGYVLTGCETKFDQALIMLDEDPDSARNPRPEGDRTVLHYDFEEGRTPPSYLQVRRNYQNAARTLQAVQLVDRGRYTALRIDRGGAKVFVGLELFNDGRTLTLTILEQKAMEQEITADEMWKALERDGFMALQILFDTGKATIQPGSQPIVAQIVALMKAQPGLRLSIEGHTDSQGSAAANLALSRERAQAVVKAVVGGGVEAGRLGAQGWGQERPVADNRTEDGRARNRRVEIVKK